MDKLYYRLTACLIGLLSCGPGMTQTETQWLQRAEILERQGVEAVQAGDRDSVERVWGEALEIYFALNQVGHQARLLGNIGQYYLQVDDPEAAIATLNKAVALAEQFDQHQAKVDFLLKLAKAYRARPNLKAAMTTYQNALTLAQRIGDINGVVDAAGSLGQLYQKIADYDNAEYFYKLAWDAAKRTGNARIAIAASAAEGDLYYERQRFGEAIERYSRALDVARRSGSTVAEMELLQSIGNAYYFLGNCEYAVAFYDWGYTVANEARDGDQSSSFLKNRGAAEYCLGRFDDALASYRQSLEIAQRSGNEIEAALILGNMGRVQIQLGNSAQAISMLEQELAVPALDARTRARSLGAMGDAHYFRNDYRKAQEFYERSLESAIRADYTRGEAFALTNMGATRLRMGNLVEAEKALRNAIDRLKSMRVAAAAVDEDRVSLFEGESRSHRLLQKVLVESGEVEQALVAAESARAQTGSRMFASGGTDNLSAFDLDDIRRVASANDLTIVIYSIVYDLDRNRESGGRLYIWAVTPAGELTFRQRALVVDDRNLDELVEMARRAAGARARGAKTVDVEESVRSDTALQRLYTLLIEPVEGLLPMDKESTVAIVPHGALFMVPFPALIDAKGVYLVERFPTVFASGIRQLAKLEGLSRGTDGALVVGDPEMPFVRAAPGEDPIQLPGLDGAREEVMMIAPLLGTHPLTGSAATEEMVREGMVGAKLIHLATHGLLDMGPSGLLNANNLGYSGAGGAIALAPSANDDGLLDAAEIAQLGLKADLVVLSACNTGRGRITGDGVLGLSRAFLLAGARSTLVSLWRVPDQATSTLMVHFYQLVTAGAAFPLALRQAMLFTREKYPEPANWSGFVLMSGG